MVKYSLALSLVLGCAPQPSSGVSALQDAPRLVHVSRVWASPAGTDGVPLYTLAWEHADGSREPAGVGPVAHAVVWGGAILYVDSERVLRSSRGDVLSLSVVDAPSVSPAGDRLAYVVMEEGPTGMRAAVHMRTQDQDLVWDRSLLTLGALRFSPDGDALIGVGSVNGGVAGVHVVDAHGARCLTNCALRVGQPWDDFMPLPGSASAFRFEGDELVFDSASTRIVWRAR